MEYAELPPVFWRDDPAEPTEDALIRDPAYGYDPEAVRLAYAKIGAAEQDEPGISTELLAALPDDVRLDGPEHRIKPPSSLARKIQNRIAAGETPDDAAKHVRDVIRYFTVTQSAADLVDRSRRITEGLRARGWEVRDAEHTFVDGSRYKGMSAIFSHPSGEDVEVQFHTAKSIDVKQKTHDMYDVIRDDSMSVEERSRFFDLCVAMSAQIEHPPGLANLQLGGVPVEEKSYRRPCERVASPLDGTRPLVTGPTTTATLREEQDATVGADAAPDAGPDPASAPAGRGRTRGRHRRIELRRPPRQR